MGNAIDRSKDRFARFQSALKRLSEAILQYEDITDETDIIKSMMRDSIIKRFEFTFELAWKVMKDYAEYNGYDDMANSPRNAIRLALQMGIISDTAWMSMLESRNTMAHVYDEEEADSIMGVLFGYHNLFVAFDELMTNKLSEQQ
ncbi:MAG: nucleotidyltransferase substrate binding protein [Bacteroidales bacterium]|nr:nucleotidyltransferase substrate binding protein [Bacteroidales bacterium]MBR3713892.1 nucleotidyltransferase substrate binding protein [Bacteroidales bacterium]MBR4271965.1 nucleotidyltransferase substrate binding protein [Bacteroidales bacterium]MBR4274336.1 nucleotidyltransferase substrate binding protein [Bacteroidales bacterium]